MLLKQRALEEKPGDGEPVVSTLASAVYERLRRDIVQGILPPGFRLQIDALKQRYGAGGSPIREALNRLFAQGLVAREEQKGFQVAVVSIEELDELVRTRCWLNEVCMREAIARGTAEWEEAVVLSFHRLLRAPNADGGSTRLAHPDWERRHRIFHTTLISACGSRPLVEFCDTLFDRSERYRHLSSDQDGMTRAGGRDIDAEHRAIMEATINRQAETAIRLVNEHLLVTAEKVRKTLSV